MKVMPFNKGWYEWYCVLVVYKVVNFNLPCINYHVPTPFATPDTAIDDTGTIGLYLSTDAPHSDNNPSNPFIILNTATVHTQQYTHVCRILPTHLLDQMHKGHISPAFNK